MLPAPHRNTKHSPGHVSTAPRFLITRENILIHERGHAYELRLGRADPVHVDADLTTDDGQHHLVDAITLLHPNFSTDDGMAALRRAVSELAAGQIAAGTTVDASRRMIRAMLNEPGPPALKKRREMSTKASMAMDLALGVACG